jgi:transaldolase
VNPLRALWEEHGQAVWLDYIERGLVTDGGLARLVEEDGVRGVTSNPSIFCKAITGGEAYRAAVDRLLGDRPEISTSDLYETIVIEDIQLAADELRVVYEASGGDDGFVSLEVSPHLAHDHPATVAEAHRLWRAVARPNLMIKVPATSAGIPAIEELIGNGINVNATLMFSVVHYEAVAGAYLRGLEVCERPDSVASVASFFVSRVDTAVDAELEKIGTKEALAWRGTSAVANACLAYRRFSELFHGLDFVRFADRGARVQRPLWASTSAKNPAFQDTKYVDELIAPETVNTLPTGTLEAFRDHGRPRRGLDEAMATADATMVALGGLGIDLDMITEQLQVDGVKAFADSFDELMAGLDESRPSGASS